MIHRVTIRAPRVPDRPHRVAVIDRDGHGLEFDVYGHDEAVAVFVALSDTAPYRVPGLAGRKMRCIDPNIR